MKKIIPVALVLVLALALMIVPAFADSLIAGVPNADGYMELPYLPEPGRYLLSAEFGGLDNEIVSVSRVVDFVAVPDVGLACSLPYEPTDDVSIDGTIAIAPLYIFNVDSESDSICVVYSVGETFIDIISFSLSPAPDQPAAPTGDPADVFAIFSAIGDWVLDQIPVILVLFWNAETSQLTVLGGLAILFVGIGLTALLVTLVRRFFKFV